MPSYVFNVPDVRTVRSTELANSLQQIQENYDGPIHAYTRIDLHLLPHSRVLQCNGFYPVEISCVASRSLRHVGDISTLLYGTNTDLDFHVANGKEIEEVIELVDPIFHDGPGRHFLDDNIGKEGAVVRYQNWIRNGLLNNNILFVTTGKSTRRVLGFYLVAGEKRHADLSLMGIDPRIKLRGLGAAQIHKVLLSLHEMGFSTCSAKIGLYDPGVVQLYQGCGFSLGSFSVVFHWHIGAGLHNT
jgi:hypothetical protein